MGKLMSVKEWRRRRSQAGILIGMIHDLPPSKRGEGRRIYEEWRTWRISFTVAMRRLKALSSK